MKPILIDALHINMGGALMILNHLVDRLVAKDVNFVLLKDDRCPRLRSEDKVIKMEVMSCAESVRKRYYKAHRNDFKTILCLGNIPPAIKMPVPVHTYIHNVSLLEIPKDYPLKLKFISYLKRYYINLLSKNTDTWIVQTENTKNLVARYLRDICYRKIHIYPFYHIPLEINYISFENRKDYVFIGECTKAKGHEYLIEAWVRLARRGFDKCLHLTVDDADMCKVINDAIKAGANIINHGYGSFDKVIDYYNASKATVYPSLNESLGLGIIEALEAGCDVIGPDLPYIHSVVIPSTVFSPSNTDSIVDAVLRYEQSMTPRSKLLIHDMADELIDFLNNPI